MKNIITIAITSIIASLTTVSFGDETYTANKKGNNLYSNKQYKESLQQYDDALLLSPSDSRLKMNKGSAHYQLGEFDKAEESYTAALSSDNKQQLADAHYNMGNILFKQGAQLYQSGPQEAQEKFKSALDHYIQSLDIRPNDNDTKWNLQLAHQVIKQLEQQQQQEDKDNKDQEDKNKDDKNDQDKKNDKNKQDQDNKDKQDQDQDQQKDNQDDKQSEEKQQQQESQEDKDKKDENQQSEMKEQQEKDLKKEEAKRIIEMFADDADTLNKPMKSKAARIQQPQQDW